MRHPPDPTGESMRYPSSAAVRALTVPSNWSEFGQTPQFRQGPDSSRRGYYSVRSARALSNPRRQRDYGSPARGKSIVSAAEGSFNTWLLTMASDLSDHDLGKLVDTMRAIRERIALSARLRVRQGGAGDGNRTHVSSLGS